MLNHLIKHISKSKHGGCRYRERFPDSQIVELIDVRHIFLKAVYFIYHEYHRLVGTAKHIRNL